MRDQYPTSFTQQNYTQPSLLYWQPLSPCYFMLGSVVSTLFKYFLLSHQSRIFSWLYQVLQQGRSLKSGINMVNLNLSETSLHAKFNVKCTLRVEYVETVNILQGLKFPKLFLDISPNQQGELWDQQGNFVPLCILTCKINADFMCWLA